MCILLIHGSNLPQHSVTRSSVLTIYLLNLQKIYNPYQNYNVIHSWKLCLHVSLNTDCTSGINFVFVFMKRKLKLG